MDRRVETSFEFATEAVETKPGFGDNVFNKMKNNPAVVNPPVPLADLDAINQKLQQRIANAASGNHEDIILRNDTEKDWDHLYRQTGIYVNLISNGSEAAILACGFKATKSETTPGDRPQMAVSFEAGPLKGKGVIEAGCKSEPHTVANAYIARTEGADVQVVDNVIKVTMNGETVWIVLDTHKHTVLHGLPSNKPLKVTMVPFNRKGAGPASPEQDVTPQ